jgi:hypothetical protein
MPAYPHLLATKASATVGSDVDAKMVALRRVGVPYTDEDIAGAKEAIGDKTEMDVLVAYLQGLVRCCRIRQRNLGAHLLRPSKMDQNDLVKVTVVSLSPSWPFIRF